MASSFSHLQGGSAKNFQPMNRNNLKLHFSSLPLPGVWLSSSSSFLPPHQINLPTYRNNSHLRHGTAQIRIFLSPFTCEDELPRNESQTLCCVISHRQYAFRSNQQEFCAVPAWHTCGLIVRYCYQGLNPQEGRSRIRSSSSPPFNQGTLFCTCLN